MEKDKSLNYSIEAIKLRSQMELIYNVEKSKDRDVYNKSLESVVDGVFSYEYGLNRADFLPSFINLIYEKGKKDALHELKDKL